jgi:uncharacterized protein
MSNDTPAANGDLTLTVGAQDLQVVPAKTKSNLVSRGLNAISIDNNPTDQLFNIKKSGITAYENGDHALSYKLLIEIAEQGDPEAQMYIGWLYIQDDKNPESLIFLTKSADQGWVEAQSTLGHLFFTEWNHLEQANLLAFKWLLTSANNGYKNSFGFLAYCYLDGIGTTCDAQKAFDWFLKAAPHDSRGHAQMELSNLLFIGKGVPKDWATGLKWLIKSAELGKAEAMFALGKRYAFGDRVLHDIHAGHAWLLKAAAKKGLSAMNLLKSQNYRELYERHAGEQL